MADSIPDQLGPYEILREVGRGGMGIVYLSRDTKLDRDVAIKCLPDEVSEDPDRLARFEREARVLASLNHPGIASIYGLEVVDGRRYLILEYVPGETLDQVLNHGPMPVSEALAIGGQIAEAIEAAHESGIIHRDLKPANIKFAAPDAVKVLDFGLAKAFEEPRTMSSDLATSPTYIPTNTPTIPGMVLGTAGYLSPEQARGRTVDARTDIFSFGCVLYEMLTGKGVFPGETVTDSLGATLHKEPDWEALPGDTPPTIHLLLHRCLAKDRRRRLQAIGDARIEIDEAISDPSGSSLHMAGGEAGMGRRTGLPWIGAAVLAVAAAGGAWLAKPDPPPPPALEVVAAPVDRLSMIVSARSAGFGPILAASPDGRSVALVARTEEGPPQLLLRRLGQREMFPLKGTENPNLPCFSPDGRTIAFTQRQTLRSVSLEGFDTTLSELEGWPTGLTWADDGSIYYTLWGDNQIYRIGENGGDPEVVLSLGTEGDSIVPALVHALPDGQGLLYTSYASRSFSDGGAIEVVSFQDESKQPKRLIEDAVHPIYTASGHLLFLRDTTMMAVPFDIETCELMGPVIRAVEDVTVARFVGSAQLSIANDGTLFHMTGEQISDELGLFELDEEGDPTQLTTWTGNFRDGRISPDGSRIVVQQRTEQPELDVDLYMLDLETDIHSLLTPEEGFQRSPIWSPDGAWVYYQTMDPDSGDLTSISRRRADGGGEQELLYETEDNIDLIDITPDGKTLLLIKFPTGPNDAATAGGRDIMMIHLDGEEATLEPWLATSADEADPAVSPDGRWVAHTSYESGSREVVVRPFAGQARKQISRDGGDDPFWSPDGSMLCFRADNEATGGEVVMAASVTGSDEASGDADGGAADPPPPFDAAPVVLFEMPRIGGRLEFFPPDTNRFLMVGPLETEPEEDWFEIAVTLNFFEELNARAPTGGK